MSAAEQAQPVAKFNPRFGDMLRNTMASERNPHRDAYFIRAGVTRGRLNPGPWFEMTDGKGDVWRTNPANMVPVPEQAQPADILREYAIGRVHHLNRGHCPDEVAGFDTRDPKCKVCAALAHEQAQPEGVTYEQIDSLIAGIRHPGTTQEGARLHLRAFLATAARAQEGEKP